MSINKGEALRITQCNNGVLLECAGDNGMAIIGSDAKVFNSIRDLCQFLSEHFTGTDTGDVLDLTPPNQTGSAWAELVRVVDECGIKGMDDDYSFYYGPTNDDGEMENLDWGHLRKAIDEVQDGQS